MKIYFKFIHGVETNQFYHSITEYNPPNIERPATGKLNLVSVLSLSANHYIIVISWLPGSTVGFERLT